MFYLDWQIIRGDTIDACRRMAPATDASPRTIRLFTKETGMLFFLCVENSYDGAVVTVF